MAETGPPESDELEVSLFGPGLGESVVVHLGEGEWIVVDSCRDRQRRKPAALAYFERMGIDPATSVRAVVATHWDSDHIRGLAEIVEACPDAPFWCTAAVDTDEFEALLDLTERRPDELGVRLKELAQIEARRREHFGEGSGLRFALESTLLLERHAKDNLPRRAVVALSPSSRSLLHAVENVRHVLSDRMEIPKRVQQLSRNDTSVVLMIRFGEDAALLGADLERSTDRRRGWSSVVRRARELEIRAGMVKIPHHGSADADDAQMWKDLLTSSPAAALTPFLAGTDPLPRVTDRTRIRGYTPYAYITRAGIAEGVAPLIAAALPRDAELKALEGRVGHTRWRRKAGESDQWRIELDERATPL